MFEVIEQKKLQLDSKQPFLKYTLKSLKDKMELDWIYHSNAIEGNTLTMNEIKVVLEGITVGGKTMREHLEVINHREAIRYVEEIVINGEALSNWKIKNLHRLVLKGINDEYAGVYRDQQVFIAGASHVPPASYLLNEKMEELIYWYETKGEKLHPIKRAALLHTIFVGIHPFIDGNGRTARLLLNLELMKAGYPPVIIKVENRLAYYNALDKAISKNEAEEFNQLVANAVEESLDLYLSII